MRVISGVVGGVIGVALILGGSPPASADAETAQAESRTLGGVAALAWGVRTPVGQRMVLRPHVSFDLRRRTLRLLPARKPRLSGSFVARIATRPARGRARTVAVASRRVRGQGLRASRARDVLGHRVPWGRLVLTRKQTAAVKRAAKRGSLEIDARVRFRVRYTTARGRTVVTPARSRTVTLPLGLRRQAARGGDLRRLAATFRTLLGQAGQLEVACVTRNTILQQLRNTYSTLVSGDRTGAAGLLQVYIHRAETMRRAGLLDHGQASMLGSGLGTVLRQIGRGQSKRVERRRRWRALPDCAPTGAGSAQSAPGRADTAQPAPGPAIGARTTPGDASSARTAPGRAHSAQTLAVIIIRGIAKRVLISRIVRFPLRETRRQITRTVRKSNKAEYPEDPSQPSVEAAVPEGDPTDAQPVLDDLQVQMDNYSAWAECCLAYNPALVQSYWNDVMNTFAFHRWRFQPSTTFYTLNDEIELLPLFAQYINMYLTMLHEGVIYGRYWGLTPDATLSLEDKIRAELDPNRPSGGCTGPQCPGGDAMSYAKRVYNAGLAQLGSSADPQTDFARTNEYKREMQIAVRDVMDAWHVQDPMGYPYGDPSFKLDRMIYSDAVGATTQPFAPPPNPSSPLSALTAWTTRVTTGSHNNQNWLTAIQADNSPQVGARTGATGGTPSSYGVAPGSTPGPVVQVDATSDRQSRSSSLLVGAVRFSFSDGTTAVPGGDSATVYGTTTSFAYEDEVLAAAKIMGSYPITSTTPVGDSMVLGFRPADSFSPTWNGSLPGPRRAPNTEACLGVEQVAITSGAHIGTTTGSRDDGAALQMRNCNSAEWDQTWQYIDYDDPNDPEDDAAQRELTVYAGSKCMAPKTAPDGTWATGGGFPTASSTTWPPPTHTLVAVYDCTETDPQKWTLNSDGTISPANAGNLCLDRWNGSTASGTAVQLYPCDGNPAQLWTRP